MAECHGHSVVAGSYAGCGIRLKSYTSTSACVGRVLRTNVQGADERHPSVSPWPFKAGPLNAFPVAGSGTTRGRRQASPADID